MNLRRGLWRLVFAFWLTGALGVFWWSGAELRRAPFANVCTTESDPAYEECYTEEARRLAESDSLSEQLLGRVRGDWLQIDPSRSVRRFTTERYVDALQTLAWRQAIWAGVTLGFFGVAAWIAAGFAGGRS